MRRGDVVDRLDVGSFSPALSAWRTAIKKGDIQPHRMGEVISGIRYGTGTPPPRVEPSGESVPFLRATDIKDGQVLTEKLPCISRNQPPAMDKCRLEGGELIIVRSGVNTGDCAVVPKALHGAFAAYDLIVNVNTGKALAEFLSAFLYTGFGSAQIDSVKNRAAQPHINAEEVKALEIPLPPLDVQRRLVAELDAARAEHDRAIAEADRLLGTFEPWAIAQMGLLAPKEDGRKVYAIKRNAAGVRIDPFYHSPEFVEIERTIQAVPHAPLGSLARFSSDTWNPKEHPEPTFRYIEISGVDRRRGQASASDVSVADAPSRARMVVRPDDIIVSLTRPHHGSIALLNDVHEGCIASTGFAVIRNVDENQISFTFLWAALRFSLSLKQMLRRASGGNYPAITQDELANVLIPLPDKSTQKKIAEAVVHRNNEADRLEAHAEIVWHGARARFEQQLLQGGKGRRE